MGALRENTALLAAYAIFLAVLLLLEMTAGILGFIFKDWIKDQATNGFQASVAYTFKISFEVHIIDVATLRRSSCTTGTTPTSRIS